MPSRDDENRCWFACLQLRPFPSEIVSYGGICVSFYAALVSISAAEKALPSRNDTMPTHPGQGIRRNDYPVDGNSRPLSVWTVTGARPGPVLAAIGGVHGDEMEGPLTLSALLHDVDSAELAGTMIVCPIANGEAIAAYTRCSPSDGKNLARCFPGDPRGSYTEILAALIAEHVIVPADYLVDLHSGGVALDSVTFAGYGDAPINQIVPGSPGSRRRIDLAVRRLPAGVQLGLRRRIKRQQLGHRHSC